MILWITGNSGAGKTALARELLTEHSILLDGDDVRKIWPELEFSKEDRIESNLRTARLAKLMEIQGLDVIVATICPYVEMRKRVRDICNCVFVYVPGGRFSTEKYPYEFPKDEITISTFQLRKKNLGDI